MDDGVLGLEKLIEDWTAAELRGDTAFLERALAGDFLGVGPHGFKLTKEQWLSRHETGNLKHDSFELDEVETCFYRDAAVTACRQSDEGIYKDEDSRFDIGDQFRATLILVIQRGRWLLAGLQLSPILGRP